MSDPWVEAKKKHVLVVEDEPPLATMLQRQLEAQGYRVTVHISSLRALEDFRSRPGDFDLLISDNSMPKMTGLALAREILGVRPELPALLVSGLGSVASPEELRAAGIRRVLPKPYTGKDLAEAVRDLLGPE